MRRQSRKAWLAFVLLSAAGAAPATERACLVGGADALWLVLSKDGSYRLALKLPDKPWEKLPKEVVGRIAAVTAASSDAVVFFGSGSSVRYFRQRQEEQRGVRPGASLWPAGTEVLSAAAAAADGAGILVLVNRPLASAEAAPATLAATSPAATRPLATAPAPATRTRAAPMETALLRFDGRGWHEVAVVPRKLAATPRRAHLAATAEGIYVLLERPKRTCLVFRQDRWETLPLPAELDGGELLALIAVEGQIVLAGFNFAAPGRVGLAVYADDRWQDLRLLRAGADAITWPEETAPAVARYGDGLALAWQENGRWLVAGFDIEGQQRRQGEDVFAEAGALESADKARDYFPLGVLVLLILLMFWPRQAIRSAPFSLPPAMQTARLGRRGAAFAVDVLPFALLAFLLAGGTDPQAFWQSLRTGPIRVEQVYALLGFLAAYPVYCTLLEHLFGATFGKMVLRLRVVGDGGRRPSLREVALRNISKIPEIMTPLLLLFPLFTRYRQRLGDKIAWTTVIDVGLGVPRPPRPDDAAPPPGAPAPGDEEPKT